MIVKLGQLVNSFEALQELIKQKLPIGKAWDLKDAISLIIPKIEQFNEMRNSMIVEKYGEEDKKEKGKWSVKRECFEEYQKEMNELASKDIDLDIKKILLPENCEMSVSDLMNLDWLIIKSESKKEES